MTREQTFDELARRMADIQQALNPQPVCPPSDEISSLALAIIFGGLALVVILSPLVFRRA